MNEIDMNARSLRVLEFDKIIDRLAGFAVSEMGREKANGLIPEKKP